MKSPESEIFYPRSRDEWREWLEENHHSKQSVWMVAFKKSSGKPSVSWTEAVEEALCFGWIDSKKIAIDSERSHQFFSRRKANSTWSKINKDKVLWLIDNGRMTDAGLKSIEIAKQNGSWNMLDEVENLVIPTDLDEALNQYQSSKDYFLSLSKSTRKAMLQWLVLAKLPETRQKRIAEIAELASQQRKPKQF